MKILKSKFIILLMLFSLTLVMTQVYAKTSIEIKPNASTIYTNQTISAFFDESIAMKNTGEVLEGSNVDVHMATNTDWAIISYFSNSAYGTNGEGKNAGITTSVNGKDYLSTNGNATGIMDFGKTATYTAGVVSDYSGIVDTENTEEPYDWGKSILESVNNNIHVDVIRWSKDYFDDCNTSIAAREWYGARPGIYIETNNPYSARRGLFSIQCGTHSGSDVGASSTGIANTNVTFRPMIWN